MTQPHSAAKKRDLYEFVVARHDKEQAIAVIQAKTGGQCLINAHDQGPNVKLTVILYSDTPEGDVENIMEAFGEAHLEVHSYQAGKVAMEDDF